MISIVIPTYNEQENVKVVADIIHSSLPKDTDYEIIFVDDSQDDTPKVLKSLAATDSHVRFHHRENEKGLGTAVMKGFELAHGDILMVMDADLQHPPSMIMPMVHEIRAGADIVIPSRFVPGGDDGGLRIHRKMVSAVARYMGKLSLKKVRRINDPTSGFFAFRKEVIHGVELRPVGWKILIEILVRGNYGRVSEIPYQFHSRNAGESKMSLKEQWNYVKHLVRLVLESPEDRRFFLFSAVGISGVFINMVCYGIFVHLGITVILAGTLSALIALVSNFALNDRVTWSDARQGEWFVRVGKYFITAIIGIGINVGVLDGLFNGLHIHYLLANLIGICVSTVWNYTLNNLWTWGTKPKPKVEIRRADAEGRV